MLSLITMTGLGLINCLNSKGYVVSRKKGGNANLRTKLRKRE